MATYLITAHFNDLLEFGQSVVVHCGEQQRFRCSRNQREQNRAILRRGLRSEDRERKRINETMSTKLCRSKTTKLNVNVLNVQNEEHSLFQIGHDHDVVKHIKLPFIVHALPPLVVLDKHKDAAIFTTIRAVDHRILEAVQRVLDHQAFIDILQRLLLSIQCIHQIPHHQPGSARILRIDAKLLEITRFEQPQIPRHSDKGIPQQTEGRKSENMGSKTSKLRACALMSTCQQVKLQNVESKKLKTCLLSMFEHGTVCKPEYILILGLFTFYKLIEQRLFMKRGGAQKVEDIAIIPHEFKVNPLEIRLPKQQKPRKLVDDRFMPRISRRVQCSHKVLVEIDHLRNGRPHLIQILFLHIFFPENPRQKGHGQTSSKMKTEKKL